MKLIDRAIDICVKPRATFLEIGRERAGFVELYSRYILWLAALPALAKLTAGLVARGPSAFTPRLLALSVVAAALSYLFLLASVYVLALAVDFLAPLFGGERDEDQALRLCAYALTPSFVAGATGVLPGLGWTSVLALYAIVLMVIGLPRLMRCADDKALPYGASATVAMAAIAFATSTLTARVLPS